jgi:ABC-type sugar transport system ATPase subunit
MGLAIYISHRLDEVFDLADRVTVLRDGSIVSTQAASECDRDTLVRLMVGAEAANVEASTAVLKRREPGDVLLAAEDVTFGDRVRGVSFEVRAGEIVGILGQVGAGKSNLVRHVVGAQRGSTGQIRVRGIPTRIRNPRDASSAGIGFLPEDRLEGLVPLMGVEDNILLADFGSVCGAGSTIDRTSARGVVERLIDELQIAFKSHLTEPVRYLSGGNQQKVLIARWLHRD